MFIFGAIIFIIVNSSRSINNPLLMTYFHKFVPSKMRATVISVKSMSLQLIVAIFSLVAGGLLDVFGPQKILAISGLFGVFAILTYRRIEEWNYL